MLLLIINIIPASASEKGIIVSIDNIDEIVIDNNIELKIAKNSLESKIQYYDDLDEEISRLEEEKKEFYNTVNNLSRDNSDSWENEEKLEGLKRNMIRKKVI